MTDRRVVGFFRNRQTRTHTETARLLGESDDWLHNWIRRYSPKAAPKIAKQRDEAKQRGGYSKRMYGNDVLAIFLIAYGLHDDGRETSLAISLGVQVFQRLRKEIESRIAAGATEDELRACLSNSLSVIHKIAGHSHRIHVIDRRHIADVLGPLCSAGTVTISACGLALLGLIDRVADQAELAAAKGKAA
jgi:hypothetical protein